MAAGLDCAIWARGHPSSSTNDPGTRWHEWAIGTFHAYTFIGLSVTGRFILQLMFCDRFGRSRTSNTSCMQLI